jgi:hypothetical protein
MLKGACLPTAWPLPLEKREFGISRRVAALGSGYAGFL